MPRGNVRVSVTTDPSGLEKGNKRAERSLEHLNRSGSKHLAGLKTAALSAGAAVGGGLVLGLTASAKAAIDAEKSQAKLEAQLKALNISYKAHAKEIDNVIQKTSRLAGLDDEDLQDAFTNVVRSSGSVSKSMQQMSLVADLARAKHLDVAKAGEIVGKVMAGNTGVLSRYGIVIEKGATATQALGELHKRFAGQAAAYGKTTAGAQDRLKVSTENLGEAIGKKLTPLIATIANKLATFVNQMQSGTGAGGRFAKQMRDLWEQLQPVRDTLRAIGKFLSEHPKLLAAAAAAFVTWRVAAAAASAFAKAKLIATFLGLGPKAAAGGTVAGNAFGTAATTSMRTKLRGFKWAGVGSLVGRAFGLAFGAAAALEIAGAIGKALHFDPRAATGGGGGGIKIGFGGTPILKDIQKGVSKLNPFGATGGIVAGDYAAGDIHDVKVAGEEVILNPKQQAMIGPRRIMEVLRATGAKVIGSGTRAAGGAYGKLASGGVVSGPRGAGDIIPALLKPGEVVLNERQQEMVGQGSIMSALARTGAKVIGPRGGKFAAGGGVKHNATYYRNRFGDRYRGFYLWNRYGLGNFDWAWGKGVGRGISPATWNLQVGRYSHGVGGLRDIPEDITQDWADKWRHRNRFSKGGIVRLASGGAYGKIVAAANAIDARHYPYRWGGGHNSSFSGPYDCSGAWSAILHAAGLLNTPLVSGQFAKWGDPGPGRVTLYANSGHVYGKIGNSWWGTSRANPGGGAGWFPGAPRAGFAVRHVPEKLLGGKGGSGDGKDTGVPTRTPKRKSKPVASKGGSSGFIPGSGSFSNGSFTPLPGLPDFTPADSNIATDSGDAGGTTDDGSAAQIEALNALIALQQRANDLLAQKNANTEKLFNLSQAQYSSLFAGFVDAISGAIGGRAGLGFMSPSTAGRLASY